ncbi:MAG: hypothetical protein HY216_08280 [Candidatus Rokubacteria bacterium]|nr:hypothetical protein [Candidatus Rokubacteria bacterium]
MRALRRERLVEAIDVAIGPPRQNHSDHIQTVVLHPRDELPTFVAADRQQFHEELYKLVDETERRWPTERTWQSPMGRLVRDLEQSPALDKYLDHVQFFPAVIAGKRQAKRPAEMSWIFAPRFPAASYSPAVARDALLSILREKIGHYGGIGSSVRLIVHYGRAAIYNTPYFGVDMRDFQAVASMAGRCGSGMF